MQHHFTRLCGRILLLAALGAALSGSATTLTFQPFAPTPGTNDIGNLTGTATDANNVNAGDDGGTYVAFDRGSKGQTFTTGTNPGGYQVRAVWIRHVTYGPTFWFLPPGGTFIIRVTDPAQVNTAGFVLSSETYTTSGSEANTLSTTFVNGGTGAGTWLRFAFTTPVALLPNTVYGYDVTSQSANGGFGVNPFFETDGTDSNAYAGGVAYSSGAAGVPGLDMVPAVNGVADHVFLVEMVGQALAPSIVSQPQSQMIAQGGTATFAVGVSGTAPFAYQWYFNTNTLLSGQTNATITLATTNFSVVGGYSVIVTNDGGSRTSSVARLSIILPSVTKNISFTNGTGILDSNGVATPFSTRLAGTGAAIPSPDPNLLLDPNSGVLDITSTTCDFFGQVLMDQAEAPGLNLSSIGFTGTEDFSITGQFTNLVAGANYDQLGIFAGAASTNFARAGLIFNSDFAAIPGSFGVTTPNNFDAGIVTGAAPVDQMTATMIRAGGTWTVRVNGVNVTPAASFAFLNTYTDLTAGIFALDTAGDHHNVGRLTGFSVSLYVPTLHISVSGGNMSISWNVVGGTLQSTSNLLNPNGWAPVAGASASPYVIPVPTVGAKFYRVAP